jgi:hypothetical protein
MQVLRTTGRDYFGVGCARTDYRLDGHNTVLAESVVLLGAIEARKLLMPNALQSTPRHFWILVGAIAYRQIAMVGSDR